MAGFRTGGDYLTFSMAVADGFRYRLDAPLEAFLAEANKAGAR